MKRISTVLCFILTLCVLGGALANSGNTTLFTEEQKTVLKLSNSYCISMAAVGDTVYTQWDDSVFAWQPGQEAPAMVVSNIIPDNYGSNEDAVSALGEEKANALITKFISDGTTLYGLNRHNGKLFPVSFQDGQMLLGTPLQLDWEGLDNSQESNSYTEISKMIFSGDRLFALVRKNENYNNPELLAFDRATGERKTLDVACVQDIAAYRDGKLILMILDYETAYPSDGSDPVNPQLATLNPADGSVAAIGSFGEMNVFGLVYQPGTDTLYYTADNKLMAMPGLGAATQVAYVPADSTSNADVCLLSGGLYALNTWSALIVRNTDPQYMPTSTLTIYNGYVDDTVNSFLAQYPQTAVMFKQNVYYSTAEELAKAMATADGSFDLYNIDLSYQDFTRLMDKGYCLDLSASPTLTEKLSKLYPFLQTTLQKDGKYYAVPTQMYAYGLSTSPQTWEDAGLTDRIPTSFMGLIDFINWWLDEGAEENPDIQLMSDVSDYRATLFQLALDLYVSDAQAQGQDLSLDTPVFREMLTALDGLDTDALNDTLTGSADDAAVYAKISGRMMSDSSKVLFMNYGAWLSVNNDEEYQKPLILSLEEGGEQHIPVYVSAIFVNPNTQNPDMALKYLENALDNMERDRHVMMFPDDNEPVRSLYYDEMVADWQNELDKAKKQLETAKPEEVKDIQANIDSYEDLLANKDKYIWDVSKEGIEKYRAQAPLCFTAVPNILDFNVQQDTSDISTLIDRYQQKQISLDQFIKEADQKIRMIQTERQ